jgi:hypothetical protein
MLVWVLEGSHVSTVEEVQILISLAEVEPLFLVVEELELYFFLRMSKFFLPNLILVVLI